MSDESKLSPGPWHLHVNAADYLEVRSSDGGIVGMFTQLDGPSKSDGRAIAAVPRMVELLKTSALFLEAMALDRTPTDPPTMDGTHPTTAGKAFALAVQIRALLNEMP